MAGGWVEIVSDLICILASVCVLCLLIQLAIMQYLDEPTAATLEGCGFALQPKPRDNPKKQDFSVNVWSEVHVWFCLVFYICFFAFVGLTSRKHNNSRCLGVSWTRDTGPCIIHFYIHMDNLYIYICIHTYINPGRQAGRPTDRQIDNYLIRLLDRWLDRSSTYYCCTYIYMILI